MAKKFREYITFTTKQLEEYTNSNESCVYKTSNKRLHVSLQPFCLADFKTTLNVHLTRTKVGSYDASLDAIILDLKKIVVLDSSAALRTDDSRLHINLTADCYYFRPTKGAILSGIVKHIGQQQVGVVMFRVFSASIRLPEKLEPNFIQMEQEIKFRIKDYCLKDALPYIEGELLAHNLVDKNKNKNASKDTIDTGIGKTDEISLSEIIADIKEEPQSESEQSPKNKKVKRKHKLSVSSETNDSKVKIKRKK